MAPCAARTRHRGNVCLYLRHAEAGRCAVTFSGPRDQFDWTRVRCSDVVESSLSTISRGCGAMIASLWQRIFFLIFLRYQLTLKDEPR